VIDSAYSSSWRAKLPKLLERRCVELDVTGPMDKILMLLVAIVAGFAVHGAPAAGATPTIAAVGDVACAPGSRTTPVGCRERAVADAIARVDPDSLWLLGDIQYPYGSLEAFTRSFGPAFERFRSIWHPVPGNHEYLTPGAAGYFAFFGAAAGRADRGYQSFDVGRWHVVALNSNCEFVACDAASAQAKWLRADLRRHPQRCTAALWHHPRYSSSSGHGDDPRTSALWRILQAHRAEFVLSGHDHDFEAFARQDETSRADRTGLQQFVVGTGGFGAYGFRAARPNSIARRDGRFGFLSMTLRARSYSWRFIGEDGARLAAGSARCH
jgi:hypothetical protein